MNDEYELLDSGGGRKLERVGRYLLDRQASSAWWAPRLPTESWEKADAVHVRTTTGSGYWRFIKQIPPEWQINFNGLRLMVRPTDFGHLGFFPEHLAQWRWAAERIAEQQNDGPARVLNLFAYTGAATLACARAGAVVTHVDAADGVVKWAQRNAALSGVAESMTRWITDDAMKFIQRERRREMRYHGVVLDPPSFGRAGRRVWKIEAQLPEMLGVLRDLLYEDSFIVLSCHTPGFTPTVLSNLLMDAFNVAGERVENGEQYVTEATGRVHPAGSYARFGSHSASMGQ